MGYDALCSALGGGTMRVFPIMDMRIQSGFEELCYTSRGCLGLGNECREHTKRKSVFLSLDKAVFCETDELKCGILGYLTWRVRLGEVGIKSPFG